MKKLIPLFSMFALVVLLTAVIVYGSETYNAMFTGSMFMGSFFLVFGALKVIRLRAFAMAYREYDLLAMRSSTYAHTYPFIELVLAFGYFAGFYPVAVNTITLVVMLIGALGVYRKLRQREEIPCACLGTVFKVPMTWVTLGEDLLMAAMALWMLTQLV